MVGKILANGCLVPFILHIYTVYSYASFSFFIGLVSQAFVCISNGLEKCLLKKHAHFILKLNLGKEEACTLYLC